MVFFTTVGLVTAIALVIWGIQTAVGKAGSAVEDTLMRYQLNKDHNGPKITAEDMRKANAAAAAFEKGLITEEQFDARLASLDVGQESKYKDIDQNDIPVFTCANGHPCNQYVKVCRICGTPVTNQSDQPQPPGVAYRRPKGELNAQVPLRRSWEE